MCLRLTYAEARLWKRNARKIIDDAKRAATKMSCDPLLLQVPRLSALVSEIDSIKKRHGLLIEKALIFAINRVPDWCATKERISVAGGRAHLDCLAYNKTTKRLFVFECKRGHGNQDHDKIEAIDNRLDRIEKAMPAYAASKGWATGKIRLFLLSFYGVRWKSRYSIYNCQSAAALFGPCVQTFMDHFMRHVEHETIREYAEQLRDPPIAVAYGGTIFDKIDIEGPPRAVDIQFREGDVRFVKGRRPRGSPDGD